MYTMMLAAALTQLASAGPPPPAPVVAGSTIAISGIALTATASTGFAWALTTDSHVAPYLALGVADLTAPIGPAGALGAGVALNRRGASVSLAPSIVGVGASALPLLGLAGLGLGADPDLLIVTSLAAPVISVGATAIQLGLNHAAHQHLGPPPAPGAALGIVPLEGGAVASVTLGI